MPNQRTVVVDLDDLRALVFATAAIKGIEAALDQRKRDPFVGEHLDNLTAAHQRVATAMVQAERAGTGTATDWDAPLTTEEIKAMRYVADAVAGRQKGFNLFVISAADKMDEPVYDRLQAKGMLQVGQFVQGVVWAGADRPEITADPKGYGARLTIRGLRKLEETVHA